LLTEELQRLTRLKSDAKTASHCESNLREILADHGTSVCEAFGVRARQDESLSVCIHQL
jgi:hypothetical protein